jgi:hypothetical protein
MNALESKLREAGLKFEVEDNGMARGVYRLPSGRTQTFGIHLEGEAGTVSTNTMCCSR